MPIAGAPVLSAAERAALEQDFRRPPDPLVRQRSPIVLLSTEAATQAEVGRLARCSTDTVRRALALFRAGGRSALGRAPAAPWPARQRHLAWQKALAEALERGPEGCGVARPSGTAPLRVAHRRATPGIQTRERTVRRGLASREFVGRRPTGTVRHKAEEQAGYAGKETGSSRC